MLTAGTTLGPYKILTPLGAGGMGEVYRAHDTRLGRDVAIKALPDAFSSDPDRLARFEREAKVLASLNHPNVAGIYGVEDADGHRYLALEYVEGETLAARLTRGALPLEEAIEICLQIATGMETAHESGIVHRDLKPGNVMITPGDQVKVVDFGLAKGKVAEPEAMSPESPTMTESPALHHSPTMGTPATLPGVILGTAAYLSPEQARGKAVDRRTDIWSFGCVLYECLTGRRAFEGETVSDLVATILKGDVEWARLPKGTPARLRELMQHCLEKDPRKRLRDMGDARLALEEIREGKGASVIANPARRARSLRSIALFVLAGAAAGIAVWSLGPGLTGANRPARTPVCLSIDVPRSIRATSARITPDGRTVIVSGFERKADGTEARRAQLYRRKLDGYEFRPIPGTGGVQDYTISPDGEWLAFVAPLSEQTAQRQISKVPLDGSAPAATIADFDDAWHTELVWLEDGDLLVASFLPRLQLYRVPTDGGSVRPAMRIQTGGVDGYAYLGAALPGDRGVLFEMNVWREKGYQRETWLLDPKTGKATRLFENLGSPVYVSTGHIVCTRGEAIMSAPFDLGKLRVTGPMVPLPGSVRTSTSWTNGVIGISQNGTLIYAPGGRTGTERQIAIIDPTGRVTPLINEKRAYQNESPLALTRDGNALAVVIASDYRGIYEIWGTDGGRASLRRLVAPSAADCYWPAWSPDGRWLAYKRLMIPMDEICVGRADGSGASRVVARGSNVDLSRPEWMPDGTGIAFVQNNRGSRDILLVALSDSGMSTPRKLLAARYDEFDPSISPDGKLMAFTSDESGKNEIYVSTLAANGTLGPALMVSNAGGRCPSWAGDSRGLFYETSQERVLSVTVRRGSTLTITPPEPAYDLRASRILAATWKILPDGRLVGIQRADGEDEITRFNVVLNWSDELREAVSKATISARRQ